jgi:signal transduction histidine kinase/CheY-like chemotaxis protein
MSDLVNLDLVFPEQYLRPAYVASALSVWVLVGLFAYLRRYTKNGYFSFWTVGWMFYAVWLTANVTEPVASPDSALFVIKQWCLGTAAVLLLWGSLKCLDLPLREDLLALFLGFLLVWAYAGSALYPDSLIIQWPVLAMFCASVLFVVTSFFWLRRRRPFVGMALLVFGILLCGAHLGSFPLAQRFAGLATASFLASNVLQLYMAVSMIVLLLEEAQHSSEQLCRDHEELRRDHEQLRKSSERLRQSHEQALLEVKSFGAEKQALLEQVRSAEQRDKDLSEQTRQAGDLKKVLDEQRDKQPMLLQQERLQAMGRMASVMAHDLSNLLSPIVAFSEMLVKQDSTLGNSHRQYLGQILAAGEDISAMVERMREFYRRRDRGSLSPINLNQLVEKVIALTRPRWYDQALAQGIRVEIRTELAEDLPLLQGHEHEIQQALTHLLVNAVDALPRSGQIVIATRPGGLTMDDYQKKPSHLILEVRDNGVGMEEYTRQHCVEPFFTTKDHRGGKGLGLAVVYGTMERHKGKIEIETQLGKGTTVRLVFPRRSLPSVVAASPVVTDFIAPPLRVLCVDDEPILGQLLKQLLEVKGHTVTNAYGGLSALDAFREAQREGNPFDVVITDLSMPGVDGREVARTVKAESPGTPVVLLTGFGSVDDDQEGETPTPVDEVMSKPPRLEQLNRVLAQVTQRSSTVRGAQKTAADVPLQPTLDVPVNGSVPAARN